MDETISATAPPAKRKFSFVTKIWLNIVLFILTVFSAFFVGLGWSANYKYAEEISRDPEFAAGIGAFHDPQIVGLSLLYAAVLIVILLGHELGHYLTCRRYRISATWPFFIPAPTFIGTMGAFIKIKSPITRKQQLFDIGVAGPLMSFFLSVPVLVVGLSMSKVVPPLPQESSLVFGDPLLLKIISAFFFKTAGPGHEIIPHPLAFAGWVGLLVTAMNLFPLGQLDGGHISYAVFGPKSRVIGRFFLVIFIVLGIFFWAGWLVWALLIKILGLNHPRIWDEDASLGTKRKTIGVLILIIFILSFIPDPVRGYNVIDLIRQFWR